MISFPAEHPGGIHVYGPHEGAPGYSVADGGGWLPGIYATTDAAVIAAGAGYDVCLRLWPFPAERPPITLEQVRAEIAKEATSPPGAIREMLTAALGDEYDDEPEWVALHALVMERDALAAELDRLADVARRACDLLAVEFAPATVAALRAQIDQPAGEAT